MQHIITTWSAKWSCTGSRGAGTFWHFPKTVAMPWLTQVKPCSTPRPQRTARSASSAVLGNQ
jgi:hypothetical protein